MRPLFTIQHPADQPISPRVLIHYFEGAMDAGNAGALAVDQLLMTLPSERVATFDIDALVDYRARRPTMTFVHNNYSSVTMPELVLDLLHDDDGEDVLLLHGSEPDYRWDEFVGAVAHLAVSMGVSQAVGMSGIPMAVPHTRPTYVHHHGSQPDLLPNQPELCGHVELPGSMSAYLELRLGELGLDSIWLKEGERMTVEELLKALVVASANDAAVVFAEAIAASEEEFVRLMNEKAQQLGLQNTHFVNCTGFDEEGHYTCAQDVAVLARELMTGYGEQLTRFSTIWMDSLRGGETQLVNTNRLIRFYDGATGLKTGTTDAAGHCLCATATRDGLSLISVIMGCKSSDARFEESKQLLDYGFAGFTLYQPQLPQDRLHPVAVKQGMQQQVQPQVERMPQAVVRKNEADGIEIKLELSEQLQAPVAKGQAIGWVKLVQNGSTIAQQPVTAGQEVQKLTYAKSLRLLAEGLIGMSGQSVQKQVE